MATRQTVRYVAAALAATMALIYFSIGAGVLNVVTPVDGDSSMLGFGAAAGAAFLLGAALLVAFDRRVLWILGAILQVFVVWGYFAVAPDRCGMRAIGAPAAAGSERWVVLSGVVMSVLT